MRNSRSSRNGAAAVAAAALLVALAAAVVPEHLLGHAPRVMVWTLSPVVVLIAGGLAVLWHLNVRTAAALEAGDGLIARWRVDPAAWLAFTEVERGFAQQPNTWLNDFTPRSDVPAGGVEVTVGNSGVVVDGSVHRLPRHGLPEVHGARLRRDAGSPPTIELHLYEPPYNSSGSMRPARRSTLRFPVAPGHERAAASYVAWCERGRPGEDSVFHGRGDGTDAEDLSTCSACGWQTHALMSACKRCGGAMLSRRWARRVGGVQVVLGVLLAGGIGYLLWVMAPQLLQPGVSFDGQRFTGTRLQGLAVLALLASVGTLGAVSLLAGCAQVATGRRSRAMVRTVLWVAAAVGLLVLASIVLLAMGRR